MVSKSGRLPLVSLHPQPSILPCCTNHPLLHSDSHNPEPLWPKRRSVVRMCGRRPTTKGAGEIRRSCTEGELSSLQTLEFLELNQATGCMVNRT
ncbi:hypothetical protein DPEC_G00118490 [Dallia pectoralis]|uniref:Uncharacterized protein n=1 Tax=Dallia pectoralis TaxID=75939 RepID=A0ACC2GP24_DALPE|nr:hypothetical protein DPEC_G00118490 [Dallia pectoralis]